MYSVVHIVYLCSSHFPIWWFTIREHFPQGNSITPNITSMRECTIVDGLWGIPEIGERERERERGEMSV